MQMAPWQQLSAPLLPPQVELSLLSLAGCSSLKQLRLENATVLGMPALAQLGSLQVSNCCTGPLPRCLASTGGGLWRGRLAQLQCCPVEWV
jgi:hypothetical protein